MRRDRSREPDTSSRSGGASPHGGALALRQLVRAHGGVAEGLLEAVLEGVSVDRLEDLRAGCSASELVDRATSMLTRADQFLRESTAEQRRTLRGFSPELLALAADQAFRLTHLHERHQQAVTEDKNRRESLRVTLRLGVDLLEQCAALIAKVVPTAGSATAAQLGQAASPEQGPATLAQALVRCARTAERVIREGSAAAKSRAAVYGLDGSYIELLTGTASRLAQLDAEARGGGELPSAARALEQACLATAFLLAQVAEAFEMGNRLDPQVPTFVTREGVPAVSAEERAPASARVDARPAVRGPAPPPASEMRIMALRLPVVASAQR